MNGEKHERDIEGIAYLWFLKQYKILFNTAQYQHTKKNSSKISLISPFSLVFLGKSIASSTEFDLKSSHVFVTTGNWSPVAIRDKLKDNFQVSFL